MSVPDWVTSVLACPTCNQCVSVSEMTDGSSIECRECGRVGTIRDGLASFAVTENDAAIDWYRKKTGTNFRERIHIPFTMSSLDTVTYHDYLADLKPADERAVIVDVGSGDGRNTEIWLDWGYSKVVAIDPVGSSLLRLRDDLVGRNPECLHKLLLVEADARRLPIRSKSADLVIAVEALCCLNEDYESGLRECVRIAGSESRLMISERAWEGNLVTRLFYDGVAGFVDMRDSRYLYDGPKGNLVRTRTFVESEMLEFAARAGLVVEQSKGISALSIILGYLRGLGGLKSEDESLLPEVQSMLRQLGREGAFRRAHVIVARRAAP